MGFVPGRCFGEPLDGTFDATGGGGDGAVTIFATVPSNDIALGFFDASESVFGSGFIGVDKVATGIHAIKNLAEVDDGAVLVDAKHDALRRSELIGRIGDQKIISVDGVAGEEANLDFESLHFVVCHSVGASTLCLNEA